jgi:hypothetical protein
LCARRGQRYCNKWDASPDNAQQLDATVATIHAGRSHRAASFNRRSTVAAPTRPDLVVVDGRLVGYIVLLMALYL